MSEGDANDWQKYATRIGDYVKTATLSHFNPVDTLMQRDASDIREKADFVFYPFGGADAMFPVKLFPTADTYMILALEPVGKPLGFHIGYSKPSNWMMARKK